MTSCESTTTVVELQPLEVASVATQQAFVRGQHSDPGVFSTDGRRVEECAAPAEPSSRAVSSLQRWNNPKGNIFRLSACFWCFLIMGANDAGYGPLLQSLMSHYSLTYTYVSLIFLSPFVGYIASALLNNHLHLKYGQRGISIVGSTSHVAAYIIIAMHPPFIVLIFAFILAGLGNAVNASAWSAWLGSLAQPSELLGILHACYGLGGVISPFISTAMLTKASLPWYTFYYIMIGMAGIELVSLTMAFWTSTGETYRAALQELQSRHERKQRNGLKEALFTRPAARVSWVLAVFLLCYVGVEVALGGWIVTFMSKVRHQDAFSSGMSAAGFWLGITFGRAIMGFVSPRIGIKVAMLTYVSCAAALEIVFWLVPQFIVSAIAISLQGFFLGPVFPGAVLVASKLLPKHQHVVVIGFAAAFGGCGAAVLPFITGLLVQRSGPTVLQPIILALLVVLVSLWLLLPRIEKKRD